MNGADSRLDDLLKALSARGAALRGWARPLFACALVLVAASFLAVWPDVTSTEALDQTRLLIPDDLARALSSAPIVIDAREAQALWPGDQIWRMKMLASLIALVLVIALVERFAKNLGAAVFAALAAWPILFILTAQMPLGRTLVQSAKVERVSAAGGVRLSEELRTSGTAIEFAFHLQPERFGGVLADQARFVLAQRAYNENQPIEVARQLRALSPVWREPSPLARTIVGVLDDYARAHGQDPGDRAQYIAQGRPHAGLRNVLSAWLMRFGAVALVLAALGEALGLRRLRIARRLEAEWRRLRPVEPVTGRGAFGLKPAKVEQ